MISNALTFLLALRASAEVPEWIGSSTQNTVEKIIAPFMKFQAQQQSPNTRRTQAIMSQECSAVCPGNQNLVIKMMQAMAASSTPPPAGTDPMMSVMLSMCEDVDNIVCVGTQEACMDGQETNYDTDPSTIQCLCKYPTLMQGMAAIQRGDFQTFCADKAAMEGLKASECASFAYEVNPTRMSIMCDSLELGCQEKSENILNCMGADLSTWASTCRPVSGDRAKLEEVKDTCCPVETKLVDCMGSYCMKFQMAYESLGPKAIEDMQKYENINAACPHSGLPPAPKPQPPIPDPSRSPPAPALAPASAPAPAPAPASPSPPAVAETKEFSAPKEVEQIMIAFDNYGCQEKSENVLTCVGADLATWASTCDPVSGDKAKLQEVKFKCCTVAKKLVDCMSTECMALQAAYDSLDPKASEEMKKYKNLHEVCPNSGFPSVGEGQDVAADTDVPAAPVPAPATPSPPAVAETKDSSVAAPSQSAVEQIMSEFDKLGCQEKSENMMTCVGEIYFKTWESTCNPVAGDKAKLEEVTLMCCPIGKKLVDCMTPECMKLQMAYQSLDPNASGEMTKYDNLHAACPNSGLPSVAEASGVSGSLAPTNQCTCPRLMEGVEAARKGDFKPFCANKAFAMDCLAASECASLAKELAKEVNQMNLMCEFDDLGCQAKSENMLTCVGGTYMEAWGTTCNPVAGDRAKLEEVTLMCCPIGKKMVDCMTPECMTLQMAYQSLDPRASGEMKMYDNLNAACPNSGLPSVAEAEAKAAAAAGSSGSSSQSAPVSIAAPSQSAFTVIAWLLLCLLERM